MSKRNLQAALERWKFKVPAKDASAEVWLKAAGEFADWADSILLGLREMDAELPGLPGHPKIERMHILLSMLRTRTDPETHKTPYTMPREG